MNENEVSAPEVSIYSDKSNEEPPIADILITDGIENVELIKVSEKDSDTVVKKRPNTANLEQEYSFNNEWDDYSDTYMLPSEHQKDVLDKFYKVPNIQLGKDNDSIKWSSVVQDANVNSTYKDILSKTTERSGSEFKQNIDVNNVKLQAAYPKFRSAENETIKGEAAVLRVMSHLGLGAMFQVPLWHSGFWITFKPPTESELVELQRQMLADKIHLGRETYGRLYSSTTSYTINRLIDFALNHVYDCSVKSNEISLSQLKDYICVQDMFILLWGFMATVYPRGFQYSRACTSDPETCHNVVNEKLNLSRLLWVDKNSLSDHQKAHMTQRQSQAMTKTSVISYQNDFLVTRPCKVSIDYDSNENISITFKIKNVSEFIESSFKWIGDISDSIEKIASNKLTDDDKENLFILHSNSSLLRQATHQIQSIEIGSNIIEDKDTIEKTLDILSCQPKIVESFLEKLDDFNTKATIAVIGIPTFVCPACSKEQYDESIKLPNFTNIIPLDIVQLFFDFITQRLEKISKR